jgi:hypothetical protein
VAPVGLEFWREHDASARIRPPGNKDQPDEPVAGRITGARTMMLRYAVGMKIRNKADQMTVEAEDALIAALKAKTAHPEAAITYVRKQNARGDRRHPHSQNSDKGLFPTFR